MPIRRIHNKSCGYLGISKENCDFTNKKMDEYSQEKPGCGHREKGHGLIERLNIAKEYAEITFQECKIENGKNCFVQGIKGFFNSMKASRDHIRLDKEDSQRRGTCDFL